MSDFNVLIPLDGSRLSERALTFLPAMNHMGDLRVDLVSIIDEAEDIHAPGDEDSVERERNLLETYLREVASDIRSHLGAHVDTSVTHGNPAEVILERARRDQTQLLIISTHGRSGLSRWSRGSTTDKVVRSAECPVLIVGPKAMERGAWLEAEAIPPFRQILLPLDGSSRAEKSLPVAADFARGFNSEVHLMRVVPVPFVGAPGSDAFYTALYTSQAIEDLKQAGQQYLEQVRDRMGLKAAKINVDVGTTAPMLEDYIAAESIDLVVMTSHGRSGVVRTALGSVTDRLLGGNAPILVVPARDQAD
ncbi:MAG TPA: universal stress protein [Dehalococcoidia bacterium]|nr:universal stress protein [Dehalococcoidia bacterium]